MKRKIFGLVTLVIVLALALTACSGLGRVKVDGDKQNTDYIVLSNGGSTVQYGDYVYFINGYRGYDDESGKNNVFGKVEKGALYRVKLEGTKQEDKLFDFSFGQERKMSFSPNRNPATGLPFVSHKESVLIGFERDTDGSYLMVDDEYVEIHEDQDFATTQLIAPKVIGTSGYDKGGIFIFDDYVFYASPSNKKDKAGITQTVKTEFYRAKLDGSKTELVYTTSGKGSAAEYMFYKYSGAYYLVVKDNTEVKSIKMDSKPRDAITIGTGVTGVHFPNKRTYFTGMNENTTDDFIYFLRTPTDNDPFAEGNVLEMKRPDGSNGRVISANNKNATIHGSDNGVFFYQVNGIISYSNYKETTGAATSIAGVLSNIDTTGYTWTQCISPNPQNPDDVYILASDTNGLYIIDRADNRRTLHTVEAEFVAIQGSKIYFTSGSEGSGAVVNSLFSVEMFAANAVSKAVLDTAGVNDFVTYKFDILPNFVVYFANINDYAQDYTHFKELSDYGAEGIFVGKRIDADKTPEEALRSDVTTETDGE